MSAPTRRPPSCSPLGARAGDACVATTTPTPARRRRGHVAPTVVAATHTRPIGHAPSPAPTDAGRRHRVGTTTTDGRRPPTAPPARPRGRAVAESARSPSPVDLAWRAGDDPTSTSSSRTGTIVTGRRRRNRATVLDITDLTARRRRAGPARAGLRADGDAGLRQLHRQRRRHHHRRVRRSAPTASFDRDTPREVLSIDQPYANHNGGDLAFGPTACCTSAWATAARAATRSAARIDLGNAARQDAAHRPDPSAATAVHVPPTTPSSASTAPGPRSGRSGCATRGGSRSTRPPATCGSPTSARTGGGDRRRLGRRTVRRRGLNFGWSAFEGTTLQRRPVARRATPPIYEYQHGDGGCSISGGVRVPRRGDPRPGRLVRVRRLLRRWRGGRWRSRARARSRWPPARQVDARPGAGHRRRRRQPDGVKVYVVSSQERLVRLKTT